MSQLTDHGENKLADFQRGQSMGLPTNWYIAALSAYSDSSVTEITGLGLTRASVARSLANWAGTQGDGTTLASSGTSHTTSNNNAISLGTASGSGSAVAFGLYDNSSGGNCWMVWEPEEAIDFTNGMAVELAAAQLKFSLGLTGGMTDYLCNKLIDLTFRAQAYSYPSSMWHGLFTSAPSNAGGGTEVGGGVGYARAELACSLAAISGTQGAGTTTASSGTGGRISNNSNVAHPSPTGSWGALAHGGWFDASTSGNLLWWRALTSPLTVSAGSPAPTYAADGAGWTFA